MPRRPPEDGRDEPLPEALQLMQRMQMLLLDSDRAAAFEAVGNVLVLLAITHTRDQEAAHDALDELWPQLHACMQANYKNALRVKLQNERRGATVH